MKKIIQINVTCGRGSTGKLAQSLHEGVIKAGYEARFAYGEFTPTIPDAFQIETNVQRNVRKICNRLFGRKQKHSIPGTKRLIRYLDREKPDLVHLHNIHHNVTNYPMLLAYLREKNIPTVFTLHDCWAFTGGCYHFTSKNCKGYQTDCSNCPMKSQRDDVSYDTKTGYENRRTLMEDCDHLYPVCVSKWLRDRARESYMGAMTHIPETIYNGIDTELFSPKTSNIREKYGIPEDSFIVLGVASFWTEEKGLGLFRDLADKLPEDAIIVLVGQQTESVQAGNIICIPQTENQDELAELYSTADVYVNGSLEETFGMTTAEALACGTPAVVMDSTACPEVVDENTGIVISPDVDELLRAALHVKRKGKEAYHPYCVERARNCFSEERMTQMYLSLYRSILDGE